MERYRKMMTQVARQWRKAYAAKNTAAMARSDVRIARHYSQPNIVEQLAELGVTL